jgi:tetratricopeptide (TPR) repeat protein
LVAGTGGWALWNRPAAQRFPHSQAGHYAILGRALLDHEHSAKANKEALALFDKALALDPNSVPALLGYARVMVVHVTDGWAPRDEHPARLNQAEAAIERAIKLDPTHAGAHHLRGFLWRVRGDPDRSLAALQHTLTLDPGKSWTHAELGRTKIDVGRADEAINHIETAIRINPTEPRLFNWYYWAGMAAVHAGKSETALQWLLKWREPNQLYYRFCHALVGRGLR